LCRQGFITANDVSHPEKIHGIGGLIDFIKQGL
jgi:hypothetical protein